MRLRFVPWVWERLEIPTLCHQKPCKIKIVLKALRAGTFPATSVRYFRALLCPLVEANSRPLKDYDSEPPAVSAHLSPVRQMLRVPPKPSYAGNGTLRRCLYVRARECAPGCQAPPDQDSDHTSCRLSPSSMLSRCGERCLHSWSSRGVLRWVFKIPRVQSAFKNQAIGDPPSSTGRFIP